jgi:L-iditol 2-dehydrogenase
MKALVLEEYGRLVYEDVPVPEIGGDDVLVEVKACGICGSDVHGMDGSTGRRQPPLVMGHEASGIVVETGDGVSGWIEGDRVTFDSTVYCGACHFCRRGEINLCDNRRVLGVACEEFSQAGAFAEYVSVPQRILCRLPDGVTFEQAAMVEPLSVAVHAVRRTPIYLNDAAVVVGAGMIGLLVVQVLRSTGCGRIVAVDLERDKLDLACELGADLGFNPGECSVEEEISNLTGGRGADIAYDAVGLTPTIETAVGCLRKGGTLTLIGNLRSSVEMPLQKVVARQLTLLGSCASSGEYPLCLEMMDRGVVNVDALISATPPLSEGASWFERLRGQEKGLMKVVLRP